MLFSFGKNASTNVMKTASNLKDVIEKKTLIGEFSKENEIKKANIICRNFGLSPEEIKKKLKIKDGGDDYLLFCTGFNSDLLVLNCVRLEE